MEYNSLGLVATCRDDVFKMELPPLMMDCYGPGPLLRNRYWGANLKKEALVQWRRREYILGVNIAGVWGGAPENLSLTTPSTLAINVTNAYRLRSR